MTQKGPNVRRLRKYFAVLSLQLLRDAKVSLLVLLEQHHPKNMFEHPPSDQRKELLQVLGGCAICGGCEHMFFAERTTCWVSCQETPSEDVLLICLQPRQTEYQKKSDRRSSCDCAGRRRGSMRPIHHDGKNPCFLASRVYPTKKVLMNTTKMPNLHFTGENLPTKSNGFALKTSENDEEN